MIDRFKDVLDLIVTKKYTSADKLLENMLNIEKDKDAVEKIKSFRTMIANKIMKEDSGFRSDAMYYLVGALEYYKGKSKPEIQAVAFEIGKRGDNGLDINDPEAMIKIDALGKTISHLQAICYMYAGFKLLDPQLNIGVDFKDEWKMAEMF